MGTFVITPRSQAECNQLASILHSTGRVNVSKRIKTPIRVGVPMMCFLDLKWYHTEVYNLDDLINPTYLQTNELYSLLVHSKIVL